MDIVGRLTQTLTCEVALMTIGSNDAMRSTAKSSDRVNHSPEPQFTKRYRLATGEKSGGATYTPPVLADFVAKQIVASAASLQRRTVNVLDPAVGKGELLLSLLANMRANGAPASIIVSGFDTDELALAEACLRISRAFPDIRLRLQPGSFLDFVLDRGRSSPLSKQQEPETFDLIIANPPYVRTQIIGARQAQQLGSAFGLTGRVDLYHAFLIGMSRVLTPGGTAGIIVSNRFMSTRGGASVRAALRAGLELRHVWDLGDTKLFDAAVLPAVILAQRRSGHVSSHPTRFTSIYETDAAAVSHASDAITALTMDGNVGLDDGRTFRVRHGVLDGSGPDSTVWRISTAGGDAWLSIVEAHQWGTFRAIGKIRVGVKTCADRVFTRADWHSLPELERPGLLRPLTTHHIAARFRPLTTGPIWQILYPHEVAGGSRRAVDLANFPSTRNYLEKHRRTLESRNYVVEAGRRWYEIWVPQDPSAWAAPKLVFRDISDRPIFWLDLAGTVVNGDCYWLAPDSESNEDLLWLAAAVANSTFAEAFYDHRFNNKLYSGRRRFITQYVEQFPLPDPECELSREIIRCTKAVYAIAGTPMSTVLEEQLNAMVWKAFGLSLEEVEG